jgi:hypothetical protein
MRRELLGAVKRCRRQRLKPAFPGLGKLEFLVEKLLEPVVSPAGSRSFDCVRLAPHLLR